MRHGCLVHSVEIAYNLVFFRLELDVIKEFTEDDKVTTWYQANISPKALYQTLHTTKVNLLARLPNFQTPIAIRFLESSSRKRNLERTLFVIIHSLIK